MSTSSGRSKICSCCGHALNEHAKTTESKCKKCKRGFDICQAGYHGYDRAGPLGWRICKVPCGCGERYYPDKAREARPLQPHEYVTSHPGYRPLEGFADSSSYVADTTDPGTTPAYEPTYVDLSVNGDWLEFNNLNGELISTTREHWQATTILYQGVPTPCFQLDDGTGYSYYTWSLDVDDAQEATELYPSERSLGKQPEQAPSSFSHRRTFSEESEDPLQWSEERFEAETRGLNSEMARLAVSGESSQQAEKSLAPTGGEHEPVSARMNRKGMVEFTVKSGEKKGEEGKSSRGKWKPEGQGFIYRRSDGRTFYAKEIKPAKKR
ncbi:hypothetical protein CDV36_015744 [Fusarium kuroshium]|uniref:Uncharacterized protein n=2 Tax=Fusarium solani species complex TaxID=232080 RepID=A0A3M2R8H0_9HYPO|nr:hypothetical protein CDV36_015744 [Fusarium kuroshium]RSL52174.1 hypothetical protein CEP51_015100 [Fusarium floridanum]